MTAGVRSRQFGDDQVVVGSLWMLASTIAVSAGSFVFWLVAARGADADTVGRATGLFSAVFFLSYVTSLGVPVAIARYAAGPDPVDTRRFRWAMWATALATLVGATIFAAAQPGELLEPVNRWGRVAGWLVLSAISVGVAVSVIVDVRLMGHRRWRDVFVRSAAIGVIRLPPLLLAVGDGSGFWIFLIAAGGYAVTAVPYLPGLLRGGSRGPVRWNDHRDAVHYSAVNYLSQLAVQAPFFVTPLVVALAVDDGENAAFYLSWGIMSVVYLGVHLLGRTLLVEGSRDSADVIRQARSTLALAMAVAVAATVVTVPLAPVVERIYGSDYQDMSTMLPLLMLGTVPWAVTTTALSVARARADTPQTLLVAFWSAITVIVGVAVGGVVGDSVSAAVGWVIGSVASLLVSAPVLLGQLRRP